MQSVRSHFIILGIICVWCAVSNTLVEANTGPNFDVSLLTNCWEWVVGYSTESCTQTCAQANRTCDYEKTGEILSISALSDALSTSFLLGSSSGPGSLATFCNGGVNVFPFADAPAAFAYQLFVPNPQNPSIGDYVLAHYCYFPSTPSEYTGDCDKQYIEVPSQRICSCYNDACPPTPLPTLAPVANPTVIPTPAPSHAVTPAASCYEWVVGYSRDSCTETCAEVGRTCAVGQLASINSVQALEEALSTSTLLGSSNGPGTVATFCDGGVNIWPFATAPAAFAFQTFVPDPQNPSMGIYKVSHYCYFPVNPIDLIDDCDASFVVPPSQRICSCSEGTCPPTTAPTSTNECEEWVLGYSTESCTLTCNRVSGVCNEANLASIVTQQAFYDMVAVATVIDASCPTGGNANIFCTQGINTYQFAPAPAAFSYLTHNANGDATETYCNYPTSLANLNADCDAAYVYPPSRRFCSCTMNTCNTPVAPSVNPTAVPTLVPTMVPTVTPTVNPTMVPTLAPSVISTLAPSGTPTVSPTVISTFAPSVAPTTAPTIAPTLAPTRSPTRTPTRAPTFSPTRAPSRSPTIKPTRSPTRVPTAAPTGCFKFVIGYSEKSCTETCADPEVGTGAVCENSIINTIDTLADFSSMLTSALLLGSGGSSPASVATFCKGGVNVFPFANSVAAFAYQEYVADPTPHYVANNYCYYRPAAQGVSPDTCDTKYLYPPSQRMCSCRVPSCVDNGAYPVPNYRRLDGAEEEHEEEDQLLTENIIEDVKVVTKSAEEVMEQKILEAMSKITSAVAVESVKVPVASSVLQNMWNEMPLEYQIAGAAALVLGLLCAFALYNTLTVTKTTPESAVVHELDSPISAPSSPQRTLRATRDSSKREVYIDISET